MPSSILCYCIDRPTGTVAKEQYTSGKDNGTHTSYCRSLMQMDALNSNGLCVLERTQEDFLTLVSAYADTARLCEDKSKALCYMAGEKFKQVNLVILFFFKLESKCVKFLLSVNIVYGGHVHNTGDLEAMESAAKVFLSRESPLWFCEDHILAHIINSPGNFGNQVFFYNFCILIYIKTQFCINFISVFMI